MFQQFALRHHPSNMKLIIGDGDAVVILHEQPRAIELARHILILCIIAIEQHLHKVDVVELDGMAIDAHVRYLVLCFARKLLMQILDNIEIAVLHLHHLFVPRRRLKHLIHQIAVHPVARSLHGFELSAAILQRRRRIFVRRKRQCKDSVDVVQIDDFATVIVVKQRIVIVDKLVDLRLIRARIMRRHWYFHCVLLEAKRQIVHGFAKRHQRLLIHHLAVQQAQLWKSLDDLKHVQLFDLTHFVEQVHVSQVQFAQVHLERVEVVDLAEVLQRISEQAQVLQVRRELVHSLERLQCGDVVVG
mmetsp:Transcript_27558/g.43622  ORF Transcript_27558/g.43622 Transcript_27558/m.43622 type:complete len:302 (-) Transcript_27558:229-1134(-)